MRWLCRACLGLVAAWWRTDRIRISPREGELLRLIPGSVFSVFGVAAQVRTRCVIQADEGDIVQYECETDSGLARLDVWLDHSPGDPRIQWSISGRSNTLHAQQIEVFA